MRRGKASRRLAKRVPQNVATPGLPPWNASRQALHLTNPFQHTHEQPHDNEARVKDTLRPKKPFEQKERVAFARRQEKPLAHAPDIPDTCTETTNADRFIRRLIVSIPRSLPIETGCRLCAFGGLELAPPATCLANQ